MGVRAAGQDPLWHHASADLGESLADWDFTSAHSLEAFMNQGQDAEPDDCRAIWHLDGVWEETSATETSSLAMLHMAHSGPLPSIWDLLDKRSNETLHLLSLDRMRARCPREELLRDPAHRDPQDSGASRGAPRCSQHHRPRQSR